MADAVVLEISAGFAFTAIHELLELCVRDSQLQKLARGRVSLVSLWEQWSSKAVHFPRQVSLSSQKYPETQEKCSSILICFSHSFSLLQSNCKEGYLSEQWLDQHQELWEDHPHKGRRVSSSYVCAVGLWQASMLFQKRAAGFPFESDLWGQGYRS